MSPKKTIDFKRGIKVMATENDWLVEISGTSGPTERIVIYSKNGHEVTRIASIVLRTDEKEIKPGIARGIIKKLQMRMEKELVDAGAETTRSGVETLIDWINRSFS